MSKFLMKLMVAIVLLVCTGAAQSHPELLKGVTEIKNEAQLSEWISYYYLHPRPELFVSSLQELSAMKALVKPNDGLTGFYSQVLLQNPQRIKAWTSAAANGDENLQMFMATNLWAANNSESLAAVKTLGKKSSKVEQYVNELLATPTPPVLLIPVNSPGTLDALWGGFFATGDEHYVKRIMTALPMASSLDTKMKLVGEAAKWSLTSNAQQHPKVLAICEQELGSAGISERALLQEIIASAKKGQGAAR